MVQVGSTRKANKACHEYQMRNYSVGVFLDQLESEYKKVMSYDPDFLWHTYVIYLPSWEVAT